MRLPRLRTVVLPMMFALTTVVVLAGQAQAADITPVGIGDLLPSTGKAVPKGEGTLYETYPNILVWQLDSDLGAFDFIDAPLFGIASVIMGLIATIGAACSAIVTWVFNLTSIPALEDAIARSIEGASKGMMATLLPSALAVGGLVAFIQHRRGGGGGGLSQLAWVGISGIVSVSLLTSPQTWVAGVDSARQIGANVTLTATSEGLGDGSGKFPFPLDHKPKFSGKGRDDMLRKSSDAVWRAYVATPWCVAEFGSFEVCKKYGAKLLDQGISAEDRKEWLDDNVDEDAVGKESKEWRQGHAPAGRLMILIPSLVCIVIFAALLIMLAFTSLAALLGALMLLVIGTFFASMWVIPGRPRQWGITWFDQLLARTLESTIATLVIGAVLTLQTATTQMFGEYGWLPSAGLSIAVAVVGFKFRGVVATIFGVSSSSSGGAMLGLLAAKGLAGKGKLPLPGGGSRAGGSPGAGRGTHGGGGKGTGSGSGGNPGNKAGPSPTGHRTAPPPEADTPKTQTPQTPQTSDPQTPPPPGGPPPQPQPTASLPQPRTQAQPPPAQPRAGGPQPTSTTTAPPSPPAEPTDPRQTAPPLPPNATSALQFAFRQAPPPEQPRQAPRPATARTIPPARRQTRRPAPPPRRTAAPARRPAPPGRSTGRSTPS